MRRMPCLLCWCQATKVALLKLAAQCQLPGSYSMAITCAVYPYWPPQQYALPSGLLRLCCWAAVQVTDTALQVMRTQIQLQKLVLDGCTKLTSDGMAYLQGGLAGRQCASAIRPRSTCSALSTPASPRLPCLLAYFWCRDADIAAPTADVVGTHVTRRLTSPGDEQPQEQPLSTPFTSPRHSCCCCCAGMLQLQHLSMEGCDQIGARGLAYLAPLVNLQYLNLELCSRACGLKHLSGEAGGCSPLPVVSKVLVVHSRPKSAWPAQQ